MRVLASIALAIFLPVSVAAADAGISRRDGFLRIWESSLRPASEQLYPEFADVLEGDRGFTEISFAAERGILDEAQLFHPDDALTKADAALWLLRMRNVEDLDGMEQADLPVLLEQYPIVGEGELSTVLSEAELDAMIASLDQMLRDEIHEISFYSENFHGQGTAFGETFDMNALTAAHRTFPQNTLVRVTNLDSGASVVVRINDRGPYVEGRSMDLSLAAFETIAQRSQGVLRNVRIERLGDVSLVDRCSLLVDGCTSANEQPATSNVSSSAESDRPAAPGPYQKRITRDVHFNRGVPHTASVGEEITLASTKFFVIRSITYPDGFVQRRQQWIDPDERFSFMPALLGEYVFEIGTGFGDVREFRMRVNS